MHVHLGYAGESVPLLAHLLRVEFKDGRPVEREGNDQKEAA
jgi:hypothetical protein